MRPARPSVDRLRIALAQKGWAAAFGSKIGEDKLSRAKELLEEIRRIVSERGHERG